MTERTSKQAGMLTRLSGRLMRRMREQLATGQAPLEHAILGLASGFIAGMVIILFRKCYEWLMAGLIPQGSYTKPQELGFEQLPDWLHFVLPAAGGLIIGLVLWRFARSYAQTGVPHVVYYVENRDAQLPWQNALVQFFGGLACLVTGQSVGREGPAVHLGVASNSLLGQALHLPHNSLRVLAGCGTAAAIAASFNTPIAGVIFAMEVVLAEYTIAGFIPVILAAVTGTVLARLAYGGEPLLAVPDMVLPSLGDLSLVLLLALLISCASASFVLLQRFFLRFSHHPLWIRLAVAGTLTGALALFVPQIMGVSTNALHSLLINPVPIAMLGAIIAAKLLATSVSIGLGMPGGMIAPNLFMGACIGTLLGQTINTLAPTMSDSTTLFALLGMAAMMSAVLNAPLAALMTLMELTYNPHIIFPGLLAITVANICHRELFSQPSAVTAVLQQQGVALHRDPLSQALQRLGVSSLMNTNVAMGRSEMPVQELRTLIARKLDWIVLVDQNTHYLIDSRDLATYLESEPSLDESRIDLLQIELARPVGLVDIRADLNEAWQTMLRTGHEAVCVRSSHGLLLTANIGVITRKSLENQVYHPYGAKN